MILAGGKGRRLWPASRENAPKQFLDFFSTGRTLLQQTFDRMKNIIAPENILVATNEEYGHFVSEQLPELPEENVLLEPVSRNTAPSVEWATYRILHRNEKARIVTVPADQMVMDADAFRRDVCDGLDWVGTLTPFVIADSSLYHGNGLIDTVSILMRRFDAFFASWRQSI